MLQFLSIITIIIVIALSAWAFLGGKSNASKEEYPGQRLQITTVILLVILIIIGIMLLSGVQLEFNPPETFEYLT